MTLLAKLARDPPFGAVGGSVLTARLAVQIVAFEAALSTGKHTGPK
jgi:hypothetical protein